MLKQRLRVLLGLVMQALAIKVDIMALRLEDWAHRFEDRALKKIRTLEAVPPPPPRRKPQFVLVLQEIPRDVLDWATEKPWLFVTVCGIVIAVGVCALEQMLFPSPPEEPVPAVYTGEVSNCGTVSNNVTVTTNATTVTVDMPPPHPDEISKIHDPSIHLVTTEYWRCPSVTNTLAEYCSECPHCNQGEE